MHAEFGVLLVGLALLLFVTVPTHEAYEEAKRAYWTFLTTLDGTPFAAHSRPVVLTGYHSLGTGLLGYNSGKGSEITLCVNGNANSILHVLLHEFAHQSVSEYSHSKRFWSNLEDVKAHAESVGIYKTIKNPTSICGVAVDDVRVHEPDP